MINRDDLGAAPNLPDVELLEIQAVPDRGRGRMLEGSPDEMVRELLRSLRANHTL